MILSIASLMSWTTFTSDISAAVLQGKPHHKDRTLWIKLPRDACQILGLPTTDSKLMQLKKPMYGPSESGQLTPIDTEVSDAPGRLVATFGIHVDDVLGCGDVNNGVYQKVKKQLRELFSFRM